MLSKIGEIAALFRYPVKSMRGERVDTVPLGWHGLAGDRRLAFRRAGDRAGFPWLTAGKMPELLLYTPVRKDSSSDEALPSHVRTPEGDELPLFSESLASVVGQRHGTPVEMTHLNRGIFDEASVSLITSTTAEEICNLAGQPADLRRFRPNIVITSATRNAFEEDEWVNGTLIFGENADAATVSVTNRDERCAMVNFDPDSAQADPAVMKTIVRLRDNRLGVYGTTTRCGVISVGQPVFFRAG